MKLDKALRRDKKREKRISGMKLDNRSIFTIQEAIVKKSKCNKTK